MLLKITELKWWFWDSEQKQLFKIDDSRAKSNTDFRNIEISVIRIAKRIGKSLLGWENRMGVRRSWTRDYCFTYLFLLFVCFKSV